MKRILAAVDGSESSVKAAKAAADMAKASGAQLELVYVRPAPEDESGWSQEPDGYKPYGEEVLKAVAKQLKKSASPSLLNLQGRPAEVIADLAEAKDVDLVVVGTRGRGQVAKTLLGSVADRIVSACPKPVLVVR